MKALIVLFFAIAIVLILSGCTAGQSTLAKCGNNAVEFGEQCDGTAGNCTEGKVCLNDCSCGIPAPPLLPE